MQLKIVVLNGNLVFFPNLILGGLIHFWRCIGYLLGMEDQFNLFTIEDLEFQKQLCNYILEIEIKPTIQNSTSEDAKSMSWGMFNLK